MSKQAENDIPLGTIGRVAGLRVIPPELQAGEILRWSARANRLQNRLRAVGGHLYLTNRRLTFKPSTLEAILGGKEWSAKLVHLASAAPAEDRLRTVRIELAVGGIERFRIANLANSARAIDAAIREAAQ